MRQTHKEIIHALGYLIQNENSDYRVNAIKELANSCLYKYEKECAIYNQTDEDYITALNNIIKICENTEVIKNILN